MLSSFFINYNLAINLFKGAIGRADKNLIEYEKQLAAAKMEENEEEIARLESLIKFIHKLLRELHDFLDFLISALEQDEKNQQANNTQYLLQQQAALRASLDYMQKNPDIFDELLKEKIEQQQEIENACNRKIESIKTLNTTAKNLLKVFTTYHDPNFTDSYIEEATTTKTEYPHCAVAIDKAITVLQEGDAIIDRAVSSLTVIKNITSSDGRMYQDAQEQAASAKKTIQHAETMRTALQGSQQLSLIVVPPNTTIISDLSKPEISQEIARLKAGAVVNKEGQDTSLTEHEKRVKSISGAAEDLDTINESLATLENTCSKLIKERAVLRAALKTYTLQGDLEAINKTREKLGDINEKLLYYTTQIENAAAQTTRVDHNERILQLPTDMSKYPPLIRSTGTTEAITFSKTKQHSSSLIKQKLSPQNAEHEQPKNSPPSNR
jgi:hypothetical protein